MAGTTVREIMTLMALDGTYVLGGHSGLDRQVTGVNVMEVPDIEAYVAAGEILLTTAYPVRDDPHRLVELLPRLNARGLAALAIKPLRYLERIPEGLAEAADRLGFPVLVVPDRTSFNEVIGAVLAVVLAEYGAEPARAEAIRERLTGVALTGGGLDEIARTLASALDRPVTVLDTDGAVLGSARTETGAAPGEASSGRDEPWRFAVTVAGARRGEVVVGGSSEPTLGQRRLIRQACFAAGMHMAQALASIELDRRMRVLFLEELVQGGRMDEQSLHQRARLFGWTLTGPHCVVVADCTHPLSETIVGSAARAHIGPEALAWSRGTRVVAIAPWDDPTGSGSPVEVRWREALQSIGAGPATVATGGIARRLEDLAASHATAHEALRVALLTSQPAVRYDNLTFERLLLSAPRDQLRAFVDDQIGPLVDHDAAGGELCRTLEQYLDLGNAAEAARRLFVHYNTMKHRLRRITELTGADLTAPRTRMQLSLALEAQKLLAR